MNVIWEYIKDQTVILLSEDKYFFNCYFKKKKNFKQNKVTGIKYNE